MNTYMIAKIDGKIVDLTDIESVMVHGANNWEKAETMLKEGKSIEEVSKYFCTSCGSFKEPTKACDCNN